MRSGLEMRTSRTPDGPGTSRIRASLAILHRTARSAVDGCRAVDKARVSPMAKKTESPEPPTPAVSETSPRLAGMDGLRAIAVIAVVAFHLLPTTVVGGGLGVDIFFVISGFLITGLLLSERATAGRIRLRSFWARRARRLLPALAVLVLVC